MQNGDVETIMDVADNYNEGEIEMNVYGSDFPDKANATSRDSKFGKAPRKCVRKGNVVCYVKDENINMIQSANRKSSSTAHSFGTDSKTHVSTETDNIFSGESLYKTFIFEESLNDSDTQKCIAFWKSVMEKNLKPIKCTIIENKKKREKEVTIEPEKQPSPIENNVDAIKEATDKVHAEYKAMWKTALKEIRDKKLDQVRLIGRTRCKLCETIENPMEEYSTDMDKSTIKEETKDLNNWESKSYKKHPGVKPKEGAKGKKHKKVDKYDYKFIDVIEEKKKAGTYKLWRSNRVKPPCVCGKINCECNINPAIISMRTPISTSPKISEATIPAEPTSTIPKQPIVEKLSSKQIPTKSIDDKRSYKSIGTQPSVDEKKSYKDMTPQPLVEEKKSSKGTAPLEEKKSSKPAAPIEEKKSYKEMEPKLPVEIKTYKEPTTEIKTYKEPTPEIKTYKEPTPEIKTYKEPTPEIKTYKEPTPEIKTYKEPAVDEKKSFKEIETKQSVDEKKTYKETAVPQSYVEEKEEEDEDEIEEEEETGQLLLTDEQMAELTSQIEIAIKELGEDFARDYSSVMVKRAKPFTKQFAEYIVREMSKISAFSTMSTLPYAQESTFLKRASADLAQEVSHMVMMRAQPYLKDVSELILTNLSEIIVTKAVPFLKEIIPMGDDTSVQTLNDQSSLQSAIKKPRLSDGGGSIRGEDSNMMERTVSVLMPGGEVEVCRDHAEKGDADTDFTWEKPKIEVPKIRRGSVELLKSKKAAAKLSKEKMANDPKGDSDPNIAILHNKDDEEALPKEVKEDLEEFDMIIMDLPYTQKESIDYHKMQLAKKKERTPHQSELDVLLTTSLQLSKKSSTTHDQNKLNPTVIKDSVYVRKETLKKSKQKIPSNVVPKDSVGLKKKGNQTVAKDSIYVQKEHLAKSKHSKDEVGDGLVEVIEDTPSKLNPVIVKDSIAIRKKVVEESNRKMSKHVSPKDSIPVRKKVLEKSYPKMSKDSAPVQTFIIKQEKQEEDENVDQEETDQADVKEKINREDEMEAGNDKKDMKPNVPSEIIQETDYERDDGQKTDKKEKRKSSDLAECDPCYCASCPCYTLDIGTNIPTKGRKFVTSCPLNIKNKKIKELKELRQSGNISGRTSIVSQAMLPSTDGVIFHDSIQTLFTGVMMPDASVIFRNFD